MTKMKRMTQDLPLFSSEKIYFSNPIESKYDKIQSIHITKSQNFNYINTKKSVI
jgi:hypothetical protein